MGLGQSLGLDRQPSSAAHQRTFARAVRWSLSRSSPRRRTPTSDTPCSRGSSAGGTLSPAHSKQPGLDGTDSRRTCTSRPRLARWHSFARHAPASLARCRYAWPNSWPRSPRSRTVERRAPSSTSWGSLVRAQYRPSRKAHGCAIVCRRVPRLGVTRTVREPFSGQSCVAPVDLSGRLWTGSQRYHVMHLLFGVIWLEVIQHRMRFRPFPFRDENRAFDVAGGHRTAACGGGRKTCMEGWHAPRAARPR